MRWALGPVAICSGLLLLASCSSDGQQYEQDGPTGETVTTSTSEAPAVTATTVPDPDTRTTDVPEPDPDDQSNEGTLPPNGSTEEQGGDGSTGYTEGGGDTQDDGDSVGG